MSFCQPGVRSVGMPPAGCYTSMLLPERLGPLVSNKNRIFFKECRLLEITLDKALKAEDEA